MVAHHTEDSGAAHLSTAEFLAVRSDPSSPSEANVAVVIEDPVARLRQEYEAAGLVESEMAPDPFSQFDRWFEDIVEVGLPEPNAFVIATATIDALPSARAVLMKGFGPKGLVFYTNLDSDKSADLKANPQAAATFVWVRVHRQVRFQGSVAPVPAEEADAYFAGRPRGAQIAAHASRQSEVVANRGVLDEAYREVESRYPEHVPRPESWGGWALQPDRVEFWQGQPNRFHDRIRYLKAGDGWRMERLAP